MMRFSLYSTLLPALTLLLIPRAGHAAEDYANCTGTIASLPAVINSPGTWCVGQNLSTAITSGNAIDIQADNVIVDCNDFRIDGLGAGAGTSARGVFASNRFNATVRRCGIRGFSIGVQLSGSGHAIEDNRLEGNTCYGLYIQADGSTIRRNRVFNTGGSTNSCDPYAITGIGEVDIQDNSVSGVAATSGSNGYAFGIYSAFDPGGSIVGNRIRGVAKDGSGRAFALEADNREIVRNNDLAGDASPGSNGIYCGVATGRVRDNVINGFETGTTGCTLSTGNVIKP
jgi:parallel beta-helix repeat protein